MLAGIRARLLQCRQFIVEISAFLINESESAPDAEAIWKFRRRFLKELGRSLHIPLILLERNASRYLSCFLISQCEVARAGFFRRDVRLALVKIIIRARDPRVGIV